MHYCSDLYYAPTQCESSKKAQSMQQVPNLFELFFLLSLLKSTSRIFLKKTNWGDRGWDGWMASWTQWTRVWANSRRQWRAGKPGWLQSTGSQRVRHDLATEQRLPNINLNFKDVCYPDSSELMWPKYHTIMCFHIMHIPHLILSLKGYRVTTYPRVRTIHWTIVFDQPVVIASICEQKYEVNRQNWGDFHIQ